MWGMCSITGLAPCIQSSQHVSGFCDAFLKSLTTCVTKAPAKQKTDGQRCGASHHQHCRQQHHLSIGVFSALKQGWTGTAKMPADDLTPPAKTTNKAAGKPFHHCKAMSKPSMVQDCQVKMVSSKKTRGCHAARRRAHSGPLTCLQAGPESFVMLVQHAIACWIRQLGYGSACSTNCSLQLALQDARQLAGRTQWCSASSIGRVQALSPTA